MCKDGERKMKTLRTDDKYVYQRAVEEQTDEPFRKKWKVMK